MITKVSNTSHKTDNIKDFENIKYFITHETCEREREREREKGDRISSELVGRNRQ